MLGIDPERIDAAVLSHGHEIIRVVVCRPAWRQAFESASTAAGGEETLLERLQRRTKRAL
jgi:hypothetical protein